MRQFPLRWRWLLLSAVVLFAAGGFLLRELSHRDHEQMMWDKIHPGMTPEEVDAAVTGFIRSSGYPEGSDRFLVTYGFEHSTLEVDFFYGRVLNSVLRRYPRPMFWDGLSYWLKRARTTVGL